MLYVETFLNACENSIGLYVLKTLKKELWPHTVELAYNKHLVTLTFSSVYASLTISITGTQFPI